MQIPADLKALELCAIAVLFQLMQSLVHFVGIAVLYQHMRSILSYHTSCTFVSDVRHLC